MKKIIKQVIIYLRHLMYMSKVQRYRDDRRLSFDKPRILVVMNAGIGNAIETTPFIQACRMLWQKSHITLLVPEKDIFEEWLIIDRVITTIDEIKGEHFTHTFFCTGNIPEGYGDVCDFGKIHNESIFLVGRYLKPEREYAMDMIRKCGYEGPTPPLYCSIRKPNIGFPESHTRFSIVPGGSLLPKWRHKHWPYYAQFIEALLHKFPEYQICILGSQEDHIPGNLIQNEKIIDLRGRLSVPESAWVLHKSSLAIGNDCGPMHLADACRTVSIIIYGPTCEVKNAYRYGKPVSTNIPCRPCQYDPLLDTCQDPLCMKNLDLDAIMKQVELLI